METITKTIRCELRVSEAEASGLLATMHAYQQACNFALTIALEYSLRNRKTLHDRVYRPIRTQLPELPSAYIPNAYNRVASVIRNARSNRSVPRAFRRLWLDCQNRTFRLITTPEGFYASLATVRGRLKIPLRCGAYQERELRDPQNIKIQSAIVKYDRRRKRFVLGIILERAVPEGNPTGRIVGVDMGLYSLLVATNGFRVRGGFARYLRARFFRTRRSLQRKGTKGALRVLRRLSGRERRAFQSLNHLISRRLVDSLQPGDILVLEKLTGIRQRAKTATKEQRRRLHHWSFAQLQAFLTYKARLKGIRVVWVDPRYTSQSCSRCGQLGKRDRHRFVCPTCGHKAHADWNAAWNISRVYQRGGLALSDGGLLHSPKAPSEA